MTVAAAQVRAILRDAARLLWRHWPALLTLGLLGAAWLRGQIAKAVKREQRQPAGKQAQP